MRAVQKNNFLEPEKLFFLQSSPSMREKNNFSELEQLIFCKASVFFKLLRKTMFQVPKPIHIWILGGMEAVQTCAQFFFFGA